MVVAVEAVVVVLVEVVVVIVVEVVVERVKILVSGKILAVS